MGEIERHDQWTEKEDQYVVRTVIDYIRTGKTQLEAFATSGERIGRTASAVGYRWNTVLRRNNEKAFREARKDRLMLKRNKEKEVVVADDSMVLSDFRNFEQRVRLLISRNKWMERELKELRQENDEVKQQLQDLTDFAAILTKLTDERSKGEPRHERLYPQPSD